MKGQLGTQVKDASHFALGNRSPGAAGRAGEGLSGLGSSERRGRAREQSPRGRRRGKHGGEGGKEEGGEGGRPGGLHHLRARRLQPRGRAPGDLPAHRLVGQLAHAIELLLHRGPAAALARELGEDGAARSPPQVTWLPRGASRATAAALRSLREPSGPRAAPSPGHRRLLLRPPRRPLPHPPHARRRACMVTPAAALGAGQVRPAACPQPLSGAGTRESPQAPGRLAGWSPLRLCGGRRAFWDL